MRARPTRHVAAALIGCAIALPTTGQVEREPAADPGAGPTQSESRAIERPLTARRLAGRFDFEGAATAPDPVPRYWARLVHTESSPRPGFPFYNDSGYAPDVASSGSSCVKVPSDGGSAGLRLERGALPVFPGADYRVEVDVRTTDLEHARAFVRAMLLDGAGEPIEDSRVSSEPIATKGEWAGVRLRVIGEFDEAAFMRIELLLLQPTQFRAPTLLGDHELWREDVGVAAWFDDVRVYQLPRVEISSDAPGGVWRSEQTPSVRTLVRDMTGDTLDADLIIRDVDGVIVARRTRAMRVGGEEAPWAPPLPAYGWYGAELRVRGPGGPLGDATTSFVWLPPHEHDGSTGHTGTVSQRSRFGVIADTLGPRRLAMLPVLAREARIGFVEMPAWRRTPGDADAKQLVSRVKPVLSALIDLGASVTLTAPFVPHDIAERERVAQDDALGLVLHAEPEAWIARMTPMLDAFGQRVSRWRFGAADELDAFGVDDLPALIRPARDAVALLAPGPMITTPWPADHAPPRIDDASPEPALRGVMAHVPWTMPEDRLDDVLERWRDAAPGAELTFAIESLPADRFTRRAAAYDLAKKAVRLWSAFGDRRGESPPVRLALPDPWVWHDGRRMVATPDQSVPVWRTLIDRLSNRRVVGRLPAPEGVTAFILAEQVADNTRSGGGAIVAWRNTWDAGADGPAHVEIIPDRSSVTVVDIFGNQRHRSAPTEGGPMRVEVGEGPVFIEGIDPWMALFVAEFSVEPEFVRASMREHLGSVTITNPWPERITGRLTITEPGLAQRWRMSPSGAMPFDLAPGQSVTMPIQFSFGVNEPSGPRQFVAEASVTMLSLGAPRSVTLRDTVEIGLPNLRVEAEALPGPSLDGPHVFVNIRVTNTGLVTQTVEALISAPGYATQELAISNLEPGRTAYRRVRLQDAAEPLSGKAIRVSAKPVNSPDRLNVYPRAP